MKRRNLLLVLAAGLAIPLESFAQQQDKIRRIGILSSRSRSTASNPDVYFDAFVQGMRELGYVEGKNLVIEWRFADGKYERFPGLAAELARVNPEVIVTHTTPATHALQRATRAIPIVVTAVADPVASGVAASLARPGGNITGLSVISVDVYPKQLELLKSIVPALSRVAVLKNPDSIAEHAILKSIQAAAQKLAVKILPVEARTAQEIERGFAAMKREHVDAVIVLGDAFFVGQRRQIAGLAAQHRLPSVAAYRENVEAGSLMSYGPNVAENYRRAATYVDKILKGVKPGELPIELPTKIHLAINLKTAKALGVYISKELVFRADEIIE